MYGFVKTYMDHQEEPWEGKTEQVGEHDDQDALFFPALGVSCTRLGNTIITIR